MKVNFRPYSFAFKSNSIPTLPPEGIEMGIDGDPVGAAWRKATIDKYYRRVNYESYYELPKSDEEMTRMLKSWGLNVDRFTGEITVPSELNLKPLGNNNYRGALFDVCSYDGIEAYEKLKKSGITTVIAATPDSGIKDTVEKRGMKYIDFTAKSYRNSHGAHYIFSGSAFQDEDNFIAVERLNCKDYVKYDPSYSDEKYVEKYVEDVLNSFRNKSRDFIDKLTKTVSAWQKGCCFIGCRFGTALTSDALLVINIFNPKGDIETCRKIKDIEKMNVFNLYKKLTPEDKKLMGWTKEFENSFVKRFGHIKLFP